MNAVAVFLLVSMLVGTAPDIRLVRPVVGPVIQEFGVSSPFYARYKQRGHNGIDYRVPVGTQVMAAASGEVVKIGFQENGYGVYVILQHTGYQTLYAHLSKVQVRYGQQVHVGGNVGLSGNTGASPTPHLHFELRVPSAIQPGYPDGARDPAPYFVKRLTPKALPVHRMLV